MAVTRRVAWVTVGCRGIGRACAVALARSGFDVAVTSRSKDELGESVVEIEKTGRRGLAASADVTDTAQVGSAYKTIEKKLGAPAVLVAGAGVARSAPFLKTGPDLWDRMWRLNVMGTVHAMSAALPAMTKTGWGRVVAIASVAGKTGGSYIAAYAASKHAVLGIVRSASAEFAAKGVTVNAVCPGYVDTKMTDENLRIIEEKTGLDRAAALERLLASTPQHRLVTPEEVAATVRHLCSDAAGSINGQSITIDGGGLQW